MLKHVYWLTLASFVLFTGLASAERNSGPWNLEELKKVPEATWGEAEHGVREVYYAGENFNGKPTRVFAYYAQPDGAGPFPALVLVHGGGGKAFKDWAIHWQKRGYAAIAMDLAGNGPSGRLSDGGPDQNDDAKFRDFKDDDAKNMWTYHAVANVIRAHSLLRSRAEVDPEKTALTGISWGGYLTCIVSGVDDRFQAAVPVYGCGFLAESSVWRDRMQKMPEELRERWTKTFDPGQYIGGVSYPILFLNGTNDFAYPLDSYKKTYSLAKSPCTISLVPRLAHGHIWNFRIVDDFVDSVLRGGEPLPKVSEMTVSGDTATCSVEAKTKLVRPELHYTTDTGPWAQRNWKSVAGELKDGKITAKIPAERPIVFYLSTHDDREILIATQHEELK